MVRQLIYRDLSKYFLRKIARYRTPNARFRTLLSRKLSISLQWVRVPIFTNKSNQSFRIMMKRGKILIVDDNEDILFTLKMLLRPIAESITTLNDPRELLPIISRTRFDVILLDMNFRQDAVSGKEGFHWLEEILKLDAKAVVIFITAYADTEKAVQAIKQGATDFIPKPWQNEKLIATVSSALQLSFSRTEVETLKQQKETLKKQTEALTLPPEPTRVIGESAAMQTIFQSLLQIGRAHV